MNKTEQELYQKAQAFLNECISVMKQRGSMYGDSWRRVRRITSFIDYITMKLDRVYGLILANVPWKIAKPKIKDQLIDTINYCIFTYLKMEEKE